MAEKSTSLPTEKVRITPAILSEINRLLGLDLGLDRAARTHCFSDCVLGNAVCNPTGEDERACAIAPICVVYLGARYGVGVKLDAPYDFERSKACCQRLSLPILIEAIRKRRIELDPPIMGLEELVEIEPERRIEVEDVSQIRVDTAAAPRERKRRSQPPKQGKRGRPRLRNFDPRVHVDGLEKRPNWWRSLANIVPVSKPDHPLTVAEAKERLAKIGFRAKSGSRMAVVLESAAKKMSLDGILLAMKREGYVPSSHIVKLAVKAGAIEERNGRYVLGGH